MNAILPASEPGAAFSSDSRSGKRTTWPLTVPPGLPPSAVSTSGCACGPSTSADWPRRSHFGNVTGSVQTLSKPSSANLAFAHSTARASASLPASRGPTSVVSDSVTCQPESSCSAVARSVAAVSIAASGMVFAGCPAAAGGEASRAASRASDSGTARMRSSGVEKERDRSLTSAAPCPFVPQVTPSARAQAVPDLAQQHDFLRRFRRGGRFLLLLAQAVVGAQEQEDDERDQQEIDDRLDERPIGD